MTDPTTTDLMAEITALHVQLEVELLNVDNWTRTAVGHLGTIEALENVLTGVLVAKAALHAKVDSLEAACAHA